MAPEYSEQTIFFFFGGGGKPLHKQWLLLPLPPPPPQEKKKKKEKKESCVSWERSGAADIMAIKSKYYVTSDVKRVTDEPAESWRLLEGEKDILHKMKLKLRLLHVIYMVKLACLIFYPLLPAGRNAHLRYFFAKPIWGYSPRPRTHMQSFT